MDKKEILDLLHEIRDGKTAPEDALLKMQTMPFKDLGYAKVDLHRAFRQSVAEVVFGEKKTPEQIKGIAESMIESGIDNILITRISKQTADFLLKENFNLRYFEIARLAVINPKPINPVGNVVIASAGTSDMPICEEAAVTLEILGNNVIRLYDVGVSGLHRLLARQEILAKAKVIIAVAGMEGALASVIAGLVSCPVIAVPTSVGYGANFNGLSALLAMLNSCSNGVSVVNIDNGFGAAYIANSINKMGEK